MTIARRPPSSSSAGATAASTPPRRRRDERGYVRVDEHLRVVGETQTFALGDLSDADRDMAAIANAQAGVVAANVRALITGTGSSPATRRSLP